ncbi:MAG: zf-HC2 domain-containing protein [Gammaproteobacteria bacterium]|nr:zf-HC2 domain-containing protein [Gammaproteobacteria bacterium]
MTEGPHLATDLMMEYLESSEKNRWRELHLHLARCSICRSKLTGLQRVMDEVMAFVPLTSQAKSSAHVDEISLANFVDGKLDEARHSFIQEHVEHCQACRHAMLHYHVQQSHGRPVTTVAQSDAERRVAFGWRLKQWLPSGLSMRFLPSHGRPVLVSLVLIFLVILVGVSRQWLEPKEQMLIANYRDSYYLRLTSLPLSPSVGFFDQGEQQEQKYQGIQVMLRHQQLHLSWPAIAGAEQYKVRIYPANDPGQQAQSITTAELEYTVKGFSAVLGERYRWELTGQTTDHLQFFMTGGFVVSRPASLE